MKFTATLSLFACMGQVTAGANLRAATNAHRETLIGGSTAGTGELPEFVFFSIGDLDCGGTLVDDDAVLTSASCIFEGAPDEVCVNALTRECNSADAISIGVAGGFVHQNYTIGGDPANNMAIIRLSQNCSEVRGSPCAEMTLNEGGFSITDADVGTKVTEYGLGTQTEGEEDYPARLFKTTTLESISDADCQAMHPQLESTDMDRVFCANLNSAIGYCDGDFGGPAVVTDAGNTVQVGVMIQVNETCADPALADVFVDVFGNIDWIQDTIASAENNVGLASDNDDDGGGCCVVRAYRYVSRSVSTFFGWS